MIFIHKCNLHVYIFYLYNVETTSFLTILERKTILTATNTPKNVYRNYKRFFKIISLAEGELWYYLYGATCFFKMFLQLSS